LLSKYVIIKDPDSRSQINVVKLSELSATFSNFVDKKNIIQANNIDDAFVKAMKILKKEVLCNEK